ncbi:MAG: HD domain-containing protein [Candidatus Nitrohelix vancouverensis]|uniref:HD domain-containing protein n=1 Tax=Candidatus Nitrohelix vancouverensis TaxID=2705534 RepID=A0A7T0BZZ6_9BACT|nr:MAG: HD domain-containing protein [Candidatus Nitrohelix vancouverensis]
MDSIVRFYRKINSDFLNPKWKDGFEIHYKVVNAGGEQRFFKFADYTPDIHERIKTMLENADSQEFFIHETDLIKFYKNFYIADLQTSLDRRGYSPALMKQAYTVACRIMKEYFDNIGSPRVLRTLTSVVDIIAQCISQWRPGIADIYAMVDKSAHHHTHCVNVGLYAMTLAVRFKMQDTAVKELGLGGMLIDIGNKELDADLFQKDELDPDERKLIRKHPSAGRKKLNDMKCFSPVILSMVGEHHEKFSGEGYPHGLAGEKISLYARVIAIMDVFDALTCSRSYREALPPNKALSMMKSEMPGHFDERLVLNFIKIIAAEKNDSAVKTT